MLTRIGNVEIWRILESVDAFMDPREFFPDMGEDGLSLMQNMVPRQLCPDTGFILLPIQGFLIKTPRHTILVDACVGNDKTCDFFENWHKRSDGRFMAGLIAAGVTPADVNFVLCTHLHVDHVGWNTRLENGHWVPTFPNARYIMPAADNAHFSADPSTAYTESVLPIIAAGQADFVAPDHMLGDYVSLIPTPGHTPGHVSVRVADAGHEAIITGDVMHSPIQCYCPEWSFLYDHDGVQAASVRRSFLASACDTGHLVLGSHFPLPSLGTVQEHRDAFEWLGK
jgi:glyoxylase-like metal-dependent hydrolase (beta-lactamase superfamily II)